MPAAFDFKGLRIVVVGAAMGLGRATAELIAELGGEVLAMDVADVDIAGAQFIRVDLKDPRSIAQAADQAGEPIHGICDIAGVSSGSGFSRLDIATINYLGVRTLTEALRPKLAPRAAIVCVSSGASKAWEGRDDVFPPLIAQPGFAQARAWLEDHVELLDGYPFSKRAMNHWAMAIKPELWAQNEIRINVVTPGVMNTRMLHNSSIASYDELVASAVGGGGRLIEPEEQAWLLAFLVSPRSGTINGQLIAADGGGSGVRALVGSR